MLYPAGPQRGILRPKCHFPQACLSGKHNQARTTQRQVSTGCLFGPIHPAYGSTVYQSLLPSHDEGKMKGEWRGMGEERGRGRATSNQRGLTGPIGCRGPSVC